MTEPHEGGPAGFATRRPHPGLRGLVGSYHGYRYDVEQPGVHHGLPSTALTLVLAFGKPLEVGWWGDESSRGSYWAVASGLTLSPAAIYQHGMQEGIAVDVTPLGARVLLGRPAAELRHGLVSLGELIGSRSTRLHAAVGEPSTWDGRFAALDRELIALAAAQDAQWQTDESLARAWHRVHASAGAVPVTALAQEIGWSRRHLCQRFTDEFGIAPKQAARLVRFQRARALVVSGHRALADVAIDCGYADQAHLTREFRQLAGDPPRAWLRAERPFVQDGIGSP